MNIRRLLLTGVLVVGALSGFVEKGTLARFTDTGSSTGDQFTAGTVDVSTSPASVLLSNTSMTLGTEVNNAVTVSNGGNLQLRYALQRSATNADGKDLRNALRLRIGLRGGGACDFPYYNANGTTTTLSDDTQLYEGVGFPASDTDTVGTSTAGSQAGDRTLNASANEVLCFAVILPTGSSGTLSSASTTATFKFVSEQTANNP